MADVCRKLLINITSTGETPFSLTRENATPNDGLTLMFLQ
jgi:hypothetical protein